MSNEKLKAAEAAGAALTRRGEIIEALTPVGTFHAELLRDGQVIWTDSFPNLVTDQGKNAMLDKFLGLGAAYAAISLGLHTTIGTAASTYATPSPQVESVVYSNATRGVPTFSAASAGAKATSAAVAFTINGSATLTGAFCAIGAAAVTTNSDTAAAASVLLSTGNFSGGSRAVISGDTLNVTYSLAL
jgi:hypothetical protein